MPPTPTALKILVYGQAKAGKSRLAETCPGPRLILDAEGKTDFLKNPQVPWTSVDNPPPSDGLTKDHSVILFVDTWQVFTTAMQWLQSGKHPFKSVVVDSLTEIQKRLRENIAGDGLMQQQQWGQLLEKLDLKVRQLRDLTKHKTNPLLSVCVTALEDERMDRKTALVQGGLAKQLPSIFDVVAHLVPTGPDEEGNYSRELYIAPSSGYDAGDSTDRLVPHYGPVIRNANLTEMLRVIQPAKGQP